MTGRQSTRQTDSWMVCFVCCFTSQQHASVSKGGQLGGQTNNTWIHIVNHMNKKWGEQTKMKKKNLKTVTDLVTVPDLHPLDGAILSAKDVHRLVEGHTCSGRQKKKRQCVTILFAHTVHYCKKGTQVQKKEEKNTTQWYIYNDKNTRRMTVNSVSTCSSVTKSERGEVDQKWT